MARLFALRSGPVKRFSYFQVTLQCFTNPGSGFYQSTFLLGKAKANHPIITPIGKIDFSNMFVILGENPSNLAGLADLKKAGIPVFAYGSFLTILVNFVILAFIIFMMVKQMNRLRNEEPVVEEAPATPEVERQVHGQLVAAQRG